MKKKSRLKDLITVFLLVLTTLVAIHFYINKQARLRLWHSLYPARAQIALWSLNCRGDSKWLEPIVKTMISEHNAPANQMVYISPTGNISQCESGYKGKPLISEKVDENTRFRYASVTKLFTSDAILSLIRQGKLDFDTRIVELFNLPTPIDKRVNDITVAHLLLHRGGFDRLQLNSEDMFYYNREPLCPKNLPKLSKIKLNFSPGTKIAYSNLGYCLLGEVIHVISGKTYQQYMNENYQLQEGNLLFNRQKPYSDEVSYNYVNLSLTSPTDFYTAYDYQGLASAAGLSGNALALAKQTVKMLSKPQPNILSADIKYDCHLSKLRDCYGYAMFPYQSSEEKMIVYFRDGNLEGLSSLVVVDEHGGVTVLLSNGVAGSNDGLDWAKFAIYNALTK